MYAIYVRLKKVRMIVQEELYKKIKSYVEKQKRENDYSELEIVVKKSKTTNSIYISVDTTANGKRILMKYRISDHYNSDIKTKVAEKSTSFNFIKRKINNMIIDARKLRFKHLSEGLSKDADKI